MRHWWDWDPVGAEPPHVGEVEVWRRHVPSLVQGTRLLLVEVVAAKSLASCPAGSMTIAWSSTVSCGEGGGGEARRGRSWMLAAIAQGRVIYRRVSPKKGVNFGSKTDWFFRFKLIGVPVHYV
jgi:hypothetical protein